MKFGSGACLIAIVSLMVLGCGVSGPATVPVKGKITKGGTGLSGISVNLIDPANPEHTAAGISDSNGEFALSYGSQGKKGAVPGRYKVVLSGGGASAANAGGADGKPTGYGSGGRTSSQAPVIETPYDPIWANAESSPMEVEVKSGMAPLEIKVE